MPVFCTVSVLSVGVLSHPEHCVLFPPWVVLSSSSSAVCRGVDQAVHFGGYGYPPWLYFEIRHQKWFTVEAVAVLQGVGRREATTAEL